FGRFGFLLSFVNTRQLHGISILKSAYIPHCSRTVNDRLGTVDTSAKSASTHPGIYKYTVIFRDFMA
ncbi:MAG: hypothetical protein QNL14_03005, partial [Deltaproteobacteria bacterium]|nr:hypothetical protein [Deltaproteobacteria bacterium]